MSIAEILIQVEKLSAAERAELIKVLHEAEAQDNQQAATAEEEKPFKTIFDVAPHLVGAIKSGLPTDLSTNKKYMEGYGTKEAEKEALLEREQNSNR